MRLNFKTDCVRLGNVEVDTVSKVTELDSGLIMGPSKCNVLEDGTLNVALSHSSLQAIEKQLAIIVPCMNEEHFILKGVLNGIPHHCLIILVSNSNADNFGVESTTLTEFCTETQRQGIVVHQQDARLAQAFFQAGMPHIVDNRADIDLQNSAGRIRNGKGEAMMIGTALAKLAGKVFVGFIDADNLVPGAVHEYCKVFAAGLHHALNSTFSSNSNDQQATEKPLAMVRIKWKSKPKIVDGKLIPKESGRCSRVVNEWMNRLFTSITGNEGQSDVIKTANAGEHAMSIDLALQLNFATGYAVEPFQLINTWERSGVFPLTPPGTPPRSGIEAEVCNELEPFEKKIKILQIETLNPHIHDFGKGEEHILKMQAQGLSTIYHSRLTLKGLKDELIEYTRKELITAVGEDGALNEARMYIPMSNINFEVFRKVVKEKVGTLKSIDIVLSE